MPGNVVCQGALCKCDQGAAPTPLTVTSQQHLTIEHMLVATVVDCAPMTNLKPFGICQQLTKLASGVATPCVPAPTGPWSPGSEIGTLLDQKILTDDGQLDCGVGGKITISDPNCSVDITIP